MEAVIARIFALLIDVWGLGCELLLLFSPSSLSPYTPLHPGSRQGKLKAVAVDDYPNLMRSEQYFPIGFDSRQLPRPVKDIEKDPLGLVIIRQKGVGKHPSI